MTGGTIEAFFLNFFNSPRLLTCEFTFAHISTIGDA
jgi:hypothetical protein